MTLICFSVLTNFQIASSSIPLSTATSHVNRVWPPTAKTARVVGPIIGVQTSTLLRMPIVVNVQRVVLQVRLETTAHLTFVSIAISPVLPAKTKTEKIVSHAQPVSPSDSLERELVLRAAQKATMHSLQIKCAQRARNLVLLA